MTGPIYTLVPKTTYLGRYLAECAIGVSSSVWLSRQGKLVKDKSCGVSGGLRRQQRYHDATPIVG